jgi:hypothetical protein
VILGLALPVSTAWAVENGVNSFWLQIGVPLGHRE